MNRDKFEAFLSSPPYELDVDRWPDSPESSWPGQYRDPTVQVAWEACESMEASVHAEVYRQGKRHNPEDFDSELNWLARCIADARDGGGSAVSEADIAEGILMKLLEDDVIQVRPSDRDRFMNEWRKAMEHLSKAGR